MRQKLFSLFLLVLAFSAAVFAQDGGLKPSVVVGDVASVAAGKIVLQTKDGAVEVALTDKTQYKRVSPEDPNPRNATPSSFSEIAAGDRLTVTGILANDKKSIPARAVYLMTKADIAGKQNKDQEQWRTRGVFGQVAAVNPQTREITISSRGAMTGSETKTVLTLKEKARVRRYAQDSVDYNQAKASSVEEIKVGDMVRALGDKSADGSTFTAEEIISGSFQTIGGTITAIDPAKNEITINNIQTKKDVVVVVGQNSVLKQFPAEMAQRLAAMQSGGAAGGMQPPGGMRPTPGQTGSAPGASGQGATNGTRPGGGMRGGNIDDMLERFPTIAVADLKVGSMIAISSTKGANVERVTAIKLLAGVEPFLKIPQAANSGGRRGADSGFSIPGLEGGF